MERGPPIPNDVMTMKPSHLTANQIVAEAQSLLLQKQPPDLTESLKPKKKKRKVPSENGETLPTVGVGGGKGCSRRPARIRTSFTNDQIQELEAHFLRCMYPRSTEIQRISSQLQLTENIVQVWFQNRRAKWRKPRNLTGIPGRPSASRMNNTQLYERNPEFIEMQTKAIMLQNRDGTTEELTGQGSGADGAKLSGDLHDVGTKEKGRKGGPTAGGNVPKSGMQSAMLPVGGSTQVPLLLTSGGASAMVPHSTSGQGAMDSMSSAQNGAQLILPMYPTAVYSALSAGGVSHQTHPSMVFQAVAPAGTAPYQLPSPMVLSHSQTSSSAANDHTGNCAPEGRFSASHRNSNTSLHSLGSGSRHGSLDNITGSRTPSCNGSNERLARAQQGLPCLQDGSVGDMCPTTLSQPQLPGYGSVDQLYDSSRSSSMLRTYSTTNIPDTNALMRARPHFQSIENISVSCSNDGVMHTPASLSYDLSSNRSQSQGSINSTMGSTTSLGQSNPPRLPSYLSQPAIGGTGNSAAMEGSLPASDPWSLASGAPSHFTSCINLGEVSSSRSCSSALPPHMQQGVSTSATSTKPLSTSQIPNMVMQSHNLQKANSYNGFSHYYRHHDDDGSMSLLGAGGVRQDSTGSLLEHQSSASTSLHSLKDHISSTSSIPITTTEGYDFNVLSDSHSQFQSGPLHGSGDFLNSPVDQTYPLDASYPLTGANDLLGSAPSLGRSTAEAALQQRRYSGTPLQPGTQLASAIRRHSVTVPVASRQLSSGPPNVEVKPMEPQLSNYASKQHKYATS